MFSDELSELNLTQPPNEADKMMVSPNMPTAAVVGKWIFVQRDGPWWCSELPFPC